MRDSAPSTVAVSHFVRFLQGASATALCVAMAGAAHAQSAAVPSTPRAGTQTADAQSGATPDSASDAPEDIIVTGIRASWANAQNI